jgi:hypothetical protein
VCYAEDGKMATVGTMVELNSFQLHEDGSMDVVRSIRAPWTPSSYNPALRNPRVRCSSPHTHLPPSRAVDVSEQAGWTGQRPSSYADISSGAARNNPQLHRTLMCLATACSQCGRRTARA